MSRQWGRSLDNCYETGAKFVLDHHEGTLVHGYHIRPVSGKKIAHAWVLLPGKGVFDEQFRHPGMCDLKTGYPRVNEYYFWTHNVPLASYTHAELVSMLKKTGHWGPWDKNSGLIEEWPKMASTQRRLFDFGFTVSDDSVNIRLPPRKQPVLELLK